MKQFIALIAAAAFIASVGTASCADQNSGTNSTCTGKAKSEQKCSDACKDKCQGGKKECDKK
jgi:hypothetical protein